MRGVWCATLFVCGAGLGAVACGDERVREASPQPLPGCEAFSYAPCDILTDSCQRELFALMACVRGEPDPGELPPVRLVSEAEAFSLVAPDGGMPPGNMPGTDGLATMVAVLDDERTFRAQVRGLELLGLVEAGQIRDGADVVDAALSSVIAYYLVPTGEIVIIDRGAPVADLDANGVLAHELVHALQDRRHGLATLGGDAALTTDGSLAIASLVEGEASLYQDLFMLAAQGAPLGLFDFPRFFAEVASYGAGLTLGAGSPLLTAPSIFPYTYGTWYAGEHWLTNGSSGVVALFSSPPSTTLEVLGGAAPSVAWEAAATPLDGYLLAGDDSAGAWVTVAMLAALPVRGGTLQLTRLARHWRGDRFWIYATEEEPQAVATTWAIDWDEAAAAEEFATLAATLAPAGAAVALDTSGRSTRITVAERADELEAWRARLAESAPPAP